MLPVLPTPARSGGPRRWLTLLLAPLLSLVLSGCFGAAAPPHRVVLEALSLQIGLTQAAIAQALDLDAQALPELSRVRVEHQQQLTIGELPGVRLSGRFDWRLAGDSFRVDTPFELYLQRGERRQSWRLARPIGQQDGEQQWLSDPLPLPASRRR
ncbi:MAG: hypothetical protein VKI42_02080 [Synechococcaceae cyanobacterium]|nr:hypothetical protein [Synechococcaceae cyanobacterium]